MHEAARASYLLHSYSSFVDEKIEAVLTNDAFKMKGKKERKCTPFCIDYILSVSKLLIF